MDYVKLKFKPARKKNRLVLFLLAVFILFIAVLFYKHKSALKTNVLRQYHESSLPDLHFYDVLVREQKYANDINPYLLASRGFASLALAKAFRKKLHEKHAQIQAYNNGKRYIVLLGPYKNLHDAYLVKIKYLKHNYSFALVK